MSSPTSAPASARPSRPSPRPPMRSWPVPGSTRSRSAPCSAPRCARTWAGVATSPLRRPCPPTPCSACAGRSGSRGWWPGFPCWPPWWRSTSGPTPASRCTPSTATASGPVTSWPRSPAPARPLLEVERTSLNLLGHLSGVATLTRTWVDAVAGTGARVRDTRKTMPLLRSLQKYAVRSGGGVNHRAGLYDAVLVKDNHVAAAGGVGAALDAVRASSARAGVVVQVEVDDLDQLREALAHGATQVLLDNMPPPLLREAVALVRAEAAGVLLEASGGLTLDTAHDVAVDGGGLPRGGRAHPLGAPARHRARRGLSRARPVRTRRGGSAPRRHPLRRGSEGRARGRPRTGPGGPPA